MACGSGAQKIVHMEIHDILHDWMPNCTPSTHKLSWSGYFSLFIFWSLYQSLLLAASVKHQAVCACSALCTCRVWEVSKALTVVAHILTTCRRFSIFWKHRIYHVSWSKFRYLWHLGSCCHAEICISVLEWNTYCTVLFQAPTCFLRSFPEYLIVTHLFILNKAEKC